MNVQTPTRARVTYRATLADGSEVELKLVIDPKSATCADAWTRLASRHGGVDPRTLEIEIRPLAPPPQQGPVIRLVRGRNDRPELRP